MGWQNRAAEGLFPVAVFVMGAVAQGTPAAHAVQHEVGEQIDVGGGEHREAHPADPAAVALVQEGAADHAQTKQAELESGDIPNGHAADIFLGGLEKILHNRRLLSWGGAKNPGDMTFFSL